MRHYFFNTSGVVYFTRIMRAPAAVHRNVPHQRARGTRHRCAGWHRGVGRLQPDLSARLTVELLDRRLVADQRDHRLAIVGAVAAFDDYVIAVADAVFDHRVALHPQTKCIVAPDELRSE